MMCLYCLIIVRADRADEESSRTKAHAKTNCLREEQRGREEVEEKEEKRRKKGGLWCKAGKQ